MCSVVCGGELIDNQLFIDKDKFYNNEYELLDEEVIYMAIFQLDIMVIFL